VDSVFANSCDFAFIAKVKNVIKMSFFIDWCL
jgi:hypothetical protein